MGIKAKTDAEMQKRITASPIDAYFPNEIGQLNIGRGTMNCYSYRITKVHYSKDGEVSSKLKRLRTIKPHFHTDGKLQLPYLVPATHGPRCCVESELGLALSSRVVDALCHDPFLERNA